MFAQNFYGFATVVGKVLIHVKEHSIETACNLSVYGERWWKKEEIPMEFVNQFLLLECQEPNWSQGIPQIWMKKESLNSLMVIHRYIRREGFFSLVHIYHISMMMHLNGDIPLCLHFFLLKGLSKMSKRIQCHPATASISIFHQRLIKTLVMYE